MFITRAKCLFWIYICRCHRYRWRFLIKSLSNFHVDGEKRVANAFGYLTIKKIIKKKTNKMKKNETCIFHCLYIWQPFSSILRRKMTSFSILVYDVSIWRRNFKLPFLYPSAHTILIQVKCKFLSQITLEWLCKRRSTT